MAWTLYLSSIVRSDTTTEAFGQLQFSGNYTTGGDAAGTVQVGGNTAGLPQYTQTSKLHASLPAIMYNLQIDGGYMGVIVPGTGATNFKIKLINPSTGAELASGAYPAALTSAIYHTLGLNYLSNL
jgi:hypothetical protein